MNDDDIKFDWENAEVLQLSDKAAQQIIELLKKPPEPNEFLLRAKENYYKNVKNSKYREKNNNEGF